MTDSTPQPAVATENDTLSTPEIDVDEVYVFPASFAQQRLWFLDQFEPNSPYYNIPSAVRLRGKLDHAILTRCINEIVRRHEALRTTFASDGGKPVQVISPRLTIAAPVVDLRHVPVDQRMAEAMRLATNEARTPFDLAHGPLLRVTLLQLTPDDHIVLVTMHHIISDGWSIGVFVAELATLYNAFSRGEVTSPLPDLPIQYADFAYWQQEWLQGEVLEAHLAYWRTRLGDLPPVLELPADRPRPAVITNRGATHAIKLPKTLTEAIKTLSKQEGCTPFMTLLAAFQILLHRYSGQIDISVGSPIANRNRGEIEALIGVFINTLVFRSNLSGDPTFRELLRQVRETALGAFAHQDLPFEMLVDALQPERDMSHSPLFQVMFILQNAPAAADEVPGLQLEFLDVDMGTATFDLTLSMAEESDGYDTSVEYNTDIFDAATIARLLQHFQTLLEGIVARPGQRISRLPLLTLAEQRQILVAWNSTDRDYLHGQPVRLHDLFTTQAARTPDAEAVAVVLVSDESVSSGRASLSRLTYAELNRRANQLARYLQSLGVGPETLVAIGMEKTLDTVVAVLGVLKAGGAYVPVDPTYPHDRVAFMLMDSGAAVVLTQEAWLATLPTGEAQVVCLDRDWPTIAAGDASEPRTDATGPDNAAYVIYTSGSTGQSKGVTISHRSIVNQYLAWEEAYRLRDEVTAHLQMAAFSFDVFTGDLVRALCSGGKLVLAPREILLAPDQLYAAMRREHIDCAEFVPAVLRHLVQYLEDTRQSLDFMRLLICGSDSWYVGEYERFGRLCGPHTRLINSFGLTEATIDSCYFEGAVGGLPADRLVPIGRPFGNTQLFVLDEAGQPLPIGVMGELYVGGAGLARGYLNRPDLTAEKFVPNPFAGEQPLHPLSSSPPFRVPSTRLYRTGDMARLLADPSGVVPSGNIEFLGRMDHQVKVRGFRIEPGEIEAVLGSHPQVRQAVVVARAAPSGEKRLVAYLVPQRSGTDVFSTHANDPQGASVATPLLDFDDLTSALPAAGALRRYLQDRLADYMVPSAFVVLPALPLTPNGKVDRNALPEPDWSQRMSDEEVVAPRTAVEEMLAHIWTQVLGVAEEISIFDNFFELGGHSLLATQLISRVRDAFQVDLPLRNVFESPTIATLAEQVEIAQRTAAGVQAPPIRPVARDQELPLSFAQQRLWFLDQLEPNSPFYNLPEAVRLKGPLDETLLERSLNAVVRRHEALRTTFRASGGRPVQVIASELMLPLPVEDLSALPAPEKEAAIQRLARAEAQAPFDLATGPLLRARLLRLADDDRIILLTMHHIVGDDWSSSVAVQEITTLYSAFSRGELTSPLPELPIQYADFAHWQRNWLQGEVLEAQLGYWKETLAGLPPLLDLPTDRPRPVMQTYNGDYISFNLPADLAQQLRALCQREGVTLFMALLASFQTLLHRYSGQDDIAVGTPIANRNRADIEGLIGFFVNTLVLRTRFGAAGTTAGSPLASPSFRQVLRQVRETALGAYAHQDLPFEMIVDTVHPLRNLSHSPLFQVMFAVQNTPLKAQALGGTPGPGGHAVGDGLVVSSVEAHSGTAKFDLTLFMVEEGEQLGGALEYNTDLFDRSTVARLLNHFERLLRAMVADPAQPVAAAPMLSDAEREQILLDWNTTAADYAEDRCVHQMIEEMATRQPEALAVTAVGDGSLSLTFAELDQRANQMARYLRKLGVGPESVVGMCAERTPDMVVGLLGVLKAGGAYLPIDPTYPADRIAFMLQDSGAEVLLTQERLLARLTAILHSRSGGIAPAAVPNIICIDGAGQVGTAMAAAESITALPTHSVAGPQNLAYVIYTSGSTGRPKGAMIVHQGLTNYLTWCLRAYPLAGGSGAPVHSSISFDLTVTSLWAPLVAGRAVTLLPDDVGVEALLAAMRDPSGGDYSLVKITPAHLELLGQQLAPTEAAGRTRAFIIGGENLLAETIAFWQHNAPDTLLVNEYGPTETVVGCCVYAVPELRTPTAAPEDIARSGRSEVDMAPSQPLAGSVPIGRPIINTQLYILDPNLQPVPIGVTGELYIGGDGVARGYLNRPDLTAERFIPNPFAGERGRGHLPLPPSPRPQGVPARRASGSRLYRTGDLARYRADGTIEYLGRTDHQVKILGFRIELGEIDAALSRHPAVKEAITLARETGQSGPKRLVAYIVPERSGADVTAGALRTFLKESLPDYMVPAAFVLLDALPLTPNGKVDRDALPAPEWAGQEPADTYVAPHTPEEEIIASIWAETLDIDPSHISAHADFFDLGGHSLLATQVLSRLRAAFAVELPLRALFEATTLAALAGRVGTERRAAQGFATPPITPAPRDQDLPLSFAQQRLWFLDQLEPGNAFYNIPAAVRLSGPLDVGALAQAVNGVIQRHEALRTTFHTVDGRAHQVIHAALPVDVPVADLRHLPAEQRMVEARRQADSVAQQAFDLATGPLLRLHLWQLDDHDHLTLLTMHHIVSDDWSMGVLIQEIGALYAAAVGAAGAGLPPLPVQYADFAVWQRQWLEMADASGVSPLQRQLRYWQEKLSDLPPLLELPTDRPRPPVQTFRGDQYTFELPDDITQRLKDLGRGQGATLFMTLLAAFQTLLYRYTGQADFAVGTPIANRNRAEIEGLIGFFVNTLVLRTPLAGEMSFRDLLARVRETALDAYAHQDVPFETLVDALHAQRDMSHSPLFQAMFVLQNAPRRGQQLTSDLTLSSIETEDAVARFDLTLTMVEDGTGLSGALEYSADLFDPETIARLAAHFQTLLASIVAQPDQAVATLPLLSAAEQAQILVTWNRDTTAAAYPLDRCVHELFEAQAAARPTATAVSYAGMQAAEPINLTYAELNQRANQLAHTLREAGVGPETLVGICVERSPEMIIGLLGILKAGGAYLPLDPNYPLDRLAYMVEDSAIRVLLTQDRIWRRGAGSLQPPAVQQAAGAIPESLRASMAVVIDLDVAWNDTSPMARQPISNPTPIAAPRHLAYVIYTSGSTGRPKGVLVPHQGLTNLVCAQTTGFGVDGACRVLQFASFSFDACVSETFMALAIGATLVLADQETLSSPPDLLEILRSQAITTVTLPPSMLRALPPTDLPALHTLISAGEPCPPDLAARWSQGRRFFNAYGPTEATIGPTYFRVSEPSATGRVPIGRPIANIQIYVLDACGQPTPIGVAGEICIGGVGVARGYLSRPDLTAEKFVPNPFGREGKSGREGEEVRDALWAAGTRLYRTGDLGRWLPDGNVEILGRIDQQVKVRGFRIELGEIEAVLARHSAVREVVVLARADGGVSAAQPDHQRLVAYIVPHSSGAGLAADPTSTAAPSSPATAQRPDSGYAGAPVEPAPALNAGELRSFLAETLPDYMVPGAFIVLEAMPLTPNGKIDRRALLTLDAGTAQRLVAQAEYVAPRTAEEATLAQIWADVLDVARVGIHDDFFELGGDSILSIQVIARAVQAGLQLTPRDLFQHPTVAGLAVAAQVASVGATSAAEPTDMTAERSAVDEFSDFGWSQDDVSDIMAQLSK